MTPFARVVIGGLVVVFALLQLVVPQKDAERLAPTTRGTMTWGYRAVVDLLTELEVPVTRFHESPDRLPAGTTAWWLAPPNVCLEPDAPPSLWTTPPSWIADGGTAVFFLPPTLEQTCRVGDLVLPSRTKAGPGVVGGLGPGRQVALDLIGFDATADGWVPRASIGTEAFIVEHALGKGRLVAVADVTILQNSSLAGPDVAPLVVDLVRAFGVPAIVEPEETTAAWSRSAIAYLARSPAATLFGGLILIGILVVWRGTLVPPRTIDGDPTPAPTLHAFIESIAALYATSSDFDRVLARYRDFTVRRLQRHLGLPPHAPLTAVVERIERGRSGVRDAHALLSAPAAVEGQDELRAAVGRLDAFVAQVVG